MPSQHTVLFPPVWKQFHCCAGWRDAVTESRLLSPGMSAIRYVEKKQCSDPTTSGDRRFSHRCWTIRPSHDSLTSILGLWPHVVCPRLNRLTIERALCKELHVWTIASADISVSIFFHLCNFNTRHLLFGRDVESASLWQPGLTPLSTHNMGFHVRRKACLCKTTDRSLGQWAPVI